MKKIFNNVEPFNNFALRDCFFSALFPAVDALGGDSNAMAILAGNDMRFRCEGFSLFQKKERISNEELEGWLDDQNIKISYNYKKKENIVDYVKQILFSDKLIMISLVDPVSIDENSKLVTQSTAGFKHWILFYGFDDNTKEFNVIDHFYIASPIYCKLKMKFSNLENSYENVNKKYGTKIFILSRTSDKITENLYSKYYEMWMNNKKKLYESVNPVLEYISYVFDNFLSEEKILNEIDFLSIIEAFYRLMVYYIKEKYIVEVLIKNCNIIKKINRQIVLINSFRTELFSIVKSKSFNDINTNAINYLQEIRSLAYEIESNIVSLDREKYNER